ncbi:MAG TPA: RidA family protein [Solirubrobacteraceae bacterium]
MPDLNARRINPPENGPANGYSHVLVVDPGVSTVYISGQVPVDEQGAVLAVGDLAGQTEVVFEHLGRALAAAGASWKDLVRMTTYLTDMRDLAAVRTVRGRFLDPTALPTSTLVEVSCLFHPDFLIEVDAIAAVRR